MEASLEAIQVLALEEALEQHCNSLESRPVHTREHMSFHKALVVEQQEPISPWASSKHELVADHSTEVYIVERIEEHMV